MPPTFGRAEVGFAGTTEEGEMAVARRAAIDIGTVTTRLLIADVDDGEVGELHRLTTVTHLGRGLHGTGMLQADAIERVVAAATTFADQIVRFGVTDVRCVATSAARDAGNGRELLTSLEALGLSPRIISGDTEARLSFTGATYAMDDDAILVADLGGGSTELVFGSAHDGGDGREIDIDAARSFDVGSRRLLDAFLHSDPPRSDELDAAAAWVADEIRPFFDGLRERPRTLVTLAGTGTTLSAVRQHLAPYDPSKVHGSHLTGGDIADLRDELAGMTVEERRRVAGMDPERADVIVAGAVILESILGLSGLDSTVVSEHDILYGLVLDTQ